MGVYIYPSVDHLPSESFDEWGTNSMHEGNLESVLWYTGVIIVDDGLYSRIL